MPCVALARATIASDDSHLAVPHTCASQFPPAQYGMTIVEAAALGALPLVHHQPAGVDGRGLIVELDDGAPEQWRVRFSRLALALCASSSERAPPAAGYLGVSVLRNGAPCTVVACRAQGRALAAACYAQARTLPEVGACDLLGDPLPLSLPDGGSGSVVLGIDWTGAPADVGAALAAWLAPATLPSAAAHDLRRRARAAALAWQQDGTTAALQHAVAAAVAST